MVFSDSRNIGQLPSSVLPSDTLLEPPQSYILRHDSLNLACGLNLLVHICWAVSADFGKDLEVKRYGFGSYCITGTLY